MSEKIDLQQEALNALKDAGLGSNSLRQASSKVIALTPTVSPARKRNMLRPSRCLDACVPSSTWKNRMKTI